MSDIPSGALDVGDDTRAISLLARVILPRPGEPLDVRKLYIEESETNARRAHAPSRTTLEIRVVDLGGRRGPASEARQLYANLDGSGEPLATNGNSS